VKKSSLGLQRGIMETTCSQESTSLNSKPGSSWIASNQKNMHLQSHSWCTGHCRVTCGIHWGGCPCTDWLNERLVTEAKTTVFWVVMMEAVSTATNASKLLQDYIVLHPRRQPTPYSPSWEPKMLQFATSVLQVSNFTTQNNSKCAKFCAEMMEKVS
jgi:hypothetical protein